jgi:hypothetical protein
VCQRCGADGHTSIECDSGKDKVDIFRQSQQPKQGVSQLIHAVDWNGVTDTLAEDEAANWTFLQNSVQFKSDGPTKCTEYDKDGTVAYTHKSTISRRQTVEYPILGISWTTSPHATLSRTPNS